MPRVDRAARAAYVREQWSQRKVSGLCVECGGQRRAESNRGGSPSLRCQVCCDRRRGAWRKSTAKRQTVFHAEHLCCDCGKVPCPDRAYCESCRERRRTAYREKHRVKRLAAHKIAHQALKRLVFKTYGGPSCKCCGEVIFEFLSLDHVHNDGPEHRHSIGFPKGGGNMYAYLKARGFPPGFQVLCMNCNFAKGHFGACPHESR